MPGSQRYVESSCFNMRTAGVFLITRLRHSNPQCTWSTLSVIAVSSACIADWDGTLRSGCILYDWLRILINTLRKTASIMLILFYAQRYKRRDHMQGVLAKLSYLCAVYGRHRSTNNVMATAFVEADRKICLFEFASELLRELDERYKNYSYKWRRECCCDHIKTFCLLIKSCDRDE
jgi:hypothetical protein